MLASCGGSDGNSGSASDDSASDDSASNDSASDDTGGAAVDDVDGLVDGLVEGLEDQQAAEGGGSATLTVGDQSWTFDTVLCAFGEDEIGQEGAEFVLSSLQDGMQMYASIDSFGHLVSLDDIEDVENPSVSLSSTGDTSIMIDGNTVTAEAEFFDNTTDSLDTVTGTFTATCP